MELQPCKRSVSIVSDETVRKRRRKAHEQPTEPLSRLVRLPSEIRMKILGNLLQSPSPLIGRSDPGLHPAILRTCKTFADDHERTPLLFTESKFVLQLSISGWESSVWFFDNYLSLAASRQSLISSVPEILLQRVQNIIVEIKIDYGVGAGPLTLENTREHQNWVVDLIKPLRGFRALKNLEIEVQNPHALAGDNPLGNDILDSLLELRGLESVTISGTSLAHARKLKTAMESSEPSESLQDMGDALREYLGDEYDEDEDWGEINDALDTYNVASFIEVRERIVRRIEAARTELRERLYRYDNVKARQAVENHQSR